MNNSKTQAKELSNAIDKAMKSEPIEVLKAGFFTSDNYGTPPDYQSRYDFFITEFLQYNSDIPKELKDEYNFLKQLIKPESENHQNNRNKYKINANCSVILNDQNGKTKYLKNIFKEGELDENLVGAFLHTLLNTET